MREITNKAVHQFTDVLNLNFKDDFKIDPKDILERVEKEGELLEALQEENDEYREDSFNFRYLFQKTIHFKKNILGYLSMHL